MRMEYVSKRWIVRVMDNGAMRLVDAQKQITWGSNIPGWLRMSGKKQQPISSPKRVGRLASGIFVEYHEENYGFRSEWTVKDEVLELKVRELYCDGELEELEYPAHLLRVDSGVKNGYVVVPHKQGTLIPSRLDAGFMRFRHNTWNNISDIDCTIPFEFSRLNMTFFGAAYDQSSVMCYMSEAADISLHVLGNAVMNENGEHIDNHQGDLPGERYSSLTPIWMASHGSLDYERVMSIILVDNGYVDMAKRYRKLVQESGRFVSLSQKEKQNPLVKNMIGAVDLKIYIYTNRRNEPRLRSWSEPILDGYSCVHTTFAQVGEIVDELREMGVSHALVLLGGWNRAGYDNEHIDMWPPAEGAGGVKGLAELSEKATDAGYIFSLHDNYQDIYPDSPSYDEKYVMKHRNGRTKAWWRLGRRPLPPCMC